MATENDDGRVIKLQLGGAQFEVDVVDLFASAVGGDPIDANIVLQLLINEADNRKAGFQPYLAQALEVLERAGDYYNVQLDDRNSLGGYLFIGKFSGSPVTFGNPRSRWRVKVDPENADSFASQNLDWVRLDSEE